jgi:WD40 repeat protein/serine/threonine protein kinase
MIDLHESNGGGVAAATVSHPSRDRSTSQARLVAAMEEVMDAMAEGNPIDRETLLAKYADVAKELEECLSNLDFVQNVAPQLADEAAAHQARHGESSRSSIEHPASNSASLGDFRIVREIGRGGMGVVYEAEQLSLGRRVALKVLPFAAMLDKQQLTRFKNEARAAATLDHPNIVAIYSVGVERGVHYYAMQLIEGQSLAQVVDQLRRKSGLEEQWSRGVVNEHAHLAASLATCVAPRTEKQKSGGGAEEKSSGLDCQLNNDSTSPLLHPSSSTSSPQSQAPSPDTQPIARLTTLPDFSSKEYYRSVAQLGIQAAEALDHAHQNGILHRDIKPANLLLECQTPSPLRGGLGRGSGDAPHLKLWITDFGLARMEADAGMTMTGDILGTLRYMSPEQALAKRVVVDHRSDIYSLGVTLYELLTLQPAFTGVDRQELLRQIAFEEPRKLRHVRAGIPVDIETIVLKAIEKNPADRYATAKELGDDLRRFLEHKPIMARAPSFLHQLNKWSRRHVAAMWTALVASLVAVTLLTVSAVLIGKSRHEANEQKLIATREKDKAIDQRDLAKLNQYYAEIVSGQVELQEHNLARLNEKLIRHLPLAGEPDRRGWEWYYLFSFCHQEIRAYQFPAHRLHISWSPDGEYIAALGAIWKAESGKCVRIFNPSFMLSNAVAWSPDSHKLAWGNVTCDNTIYMWDRTTDSVRELTNESCGPLAFSPDGQRFAAGAANTVKVWNTASGAVVMSYHIDGGTTDIKWQPGGELLAASAGGNLYIWSIASGETVTQRADAGSIAWSPDGGKLAVSTPRYWYILEQKDWKLVTKTDFLFDDSGPGKPFVHWNHFGLQLATAQGNTVTLWDAATSRPTRNLTGHIEPVHSISWSPDGRRLVTSDAHSEIRIWDLQNPPPVAISAGGPLQSLSWDADYTTLISVAADGLSLSQWSINDGKQIKAVKAVAIKDEDSGIVSPNRQLVARLSGSKEFRTITVRDMDTGAVRSVWNPQDPFALNETFDRSVHEPQLNLAWSPDNRRLAIPHASQTHECLEIWDVDTGKTISRWIGPRQWKLHSPRWSSDGTRVAIVGFGDIGDGGSQSWSPHVHVVDIHTGKRILKRLLRGRSRTGGQIDQLAWDADNRLLALATTEGLIEVIDVATGVVVMNCKAHDVAIHALAWSPDGNRLVTAAADGLVKLIEPRNGGELLSLRMSPSDTALLAWSPDGKRLAAADGNGTIHIWDASRGYEFAPDGGRRGDLAWAYFNRADEIRADTNDDELRKALEFAPTTLDYGYLRGFALARLGQYDDAANEFAAVVPSRLELGLRFANWQAYALLGARDMDAYRSLCKRLVHAVEDSQLLGKRMMVAWLATLIPNAVDSFEDNVRLFRNEIEESASKGEGGLEASDDILVRCYGAMLYRLGKYDEAMDTFMALYPKFSEASDQNGQYTLACIQYFLAMSRFQMGDRLEARKLLDEACMTDGALRRDPSIVWFQPVVLNALSREAKDLIKP